MTERILKILENVRYWDTCPEDYKKDIETFLKSHNQALCIHDVVGRSKHLLESDKLCRMNQNFVCNCIDDSKCPNF
jgi:hypothetical protein